MSSDPFAETKVGTPGGDEDPDVLEFDLSGVEDLSFHIPPKDYPAELVAVTKETSRKGDPMYNWEYKIIGSEHTGFKLWNRTVLLPQSMPFVQQTVDALGFPKGADGKSKFNKQQAIGRKVVLEVEDNEYEGEKRSQVKRVKKHPDGPGPGGGASSDFDPNQFGG